MNYAFKIVTFSCISEKTEESDEQVLEVKQKMITLESMPNVIFCLLKIFFLFCKCQIVNILFSRA